MNFSEQIITEHDELTYEYADLVHKMIELRKSLDTYLVKNENPTYTQEVQIEVQDQVKLINEHADCIMALMSALDEQSD